MPGWERPEASASSLHVIFGSLQSVTSGKGGKMPPPSDDLRRSKQPTRKYLKQSHETLQQPKRYTL